MARQHNAEFRRLHRTRNKLRSVNTQRAALIESRPRLTVHRTGKQIYAQVIDDLKGITLAAASSLDEGLKLEKGSDAEAAQKVGNCWLTAPKSRRRQGPVRPWLLSLSRPGESHGRWRARRRAGILRV